LAEFFNKSIAEASMQSHTVPDKEHTYISKYFFNFERIKPGLKNQHGVPEIFISLPA